ncbi:MAG TPA: glycerophosphodiester phosphodiesterase [Gemmatimonadaceae bacterium]|nr:glycerophosphodiester phosphodiesterase [Gemmatimonadaceae bacterium]
MPPEIIAHRGVPRERPENTLAAFDLALDQGADGIELDVHATRDGVVVVHHDAELRGDGEPARISELTLTELRGRAASRAPDEGVPTLAEVLALVGERARVYVEVKAAGIEEHVVAAIRAAGGDCAVHAFDHRIARRVRTLAPEIPVGILLASYLLDIRGAIHLAGATAVWQQWDLVDAALVRDAAAAGARVVAWTVNEPADARRLARLGVSALCTDVPAATRFALATLAPGEPDR